MIMEYKLKEFSSPQAMMSSDFYELKSFHWEAPVPYRPQTFGNIGVISDSLFAILKCYEAEPKAVYTKRDEPIYEDSCLELFVAPVSERKEYINVECNSKGVFLCEFGDGKYNRRLVRSLTELSPEVESFCGTDSKGDYWGVKIQLTRSFVADLYCIDENNINFDTVRLNFYKCGDGCETQHYLAFSPVTTLPPGFHNPQCFATFKREN